MIEYMKELLDKFLSALLSLFPVSLSGFPLRYEGFYRFPACRSTVLSSFSGSFLYKSLLYSVSMRAPDPGTAFTVFAEALKPPRPAAFLPARTPSLSRRLSRGVEMVVRVIDCEQFF